ncbi:PREDICTED: uncharacterized protein LOC106815435 [Priapulus caudatus]|uniref:Uncharacterized protein LOC106815435 n=1 Tax=Priapulus caudatus TaxID=37621 RepID=A0ABM1ET59_PRICU|nr:PREDICTED: uncharacterized protein LOC106815435 [Priapulus caudatus]
MYTDVDRRLAGDMPRKHDACVRWSFRSMELVVCSYILYAWQWLCMLLRRPLTYLWPADSQTPQYELPGTDSFEWRCLCSLNTRRAQHDSAPLQWSGELAEMAQQWAGSIAQKGFLQYSETKGEQHR